MLAAPASVSPFICRGRLPRTHAYLLWRGRRCARFGEESQPEEMAVDFTNAPLLPRVQQLPRPEPVYLTPARMRVLELFLAELNRRLTPFVTPVEPEVRW